MKCGRGHQHGSVAEVRACYAEREGYFREPSPTGNGSFAFANAEAASLRDAEMEAEFTRQIQEREREEAEAVARYKMNRDRGMTDEQRAARERSRGTGSAFDIRRPGNCDLEPGGYAVPSRTGHNDLDFWWVDRPTEGKWTGWTFCERVIGGNPNVRVGRDEQKATLVVLSGLSASDREAAQKLYGQEIGRCYVCGRTLTDEASRAAGIGPVCANR